MDLTCRGHRWRSPFWDVHIFTAHVSTDRPSSRQNVSLEQEHSQTLKQFIHCFHELSARTAERFVKTTVDLGKIEAIDLIPYSICQTSGQSEKNIHTNIFQPESSLFPRIIHHLDGTFREDGYRLENLRDTDLSPWSNLQSRGTFCHNSHRPWTLRAYRPILTDPPWEHQTLLL